MAGRIATMRLPVQKGQKHVKAKIRQESVRHLAFIRGLPCVLTGRTDGVQAHHLLRCPDSEERGGAMKAGDRWTIPIVRRMHDALHASGDEIAFLGAHSVYGPAVAALLWSLSSNQEQAERAIGHVLDLVRLHAVTEPLCRING